MLYDLSRVVVLPTPLGVSIPVLILYGLVGYAFLAPSMVRREVENFRKWPWIGLVICRLFQGFFGILVKVHKSVLTEQRPYLILLFTMFWDLGLVFLLLGIFAAAAVVFHVGRGLELQFNRLQCLWTFSSGTAVAVGHIMQASNVAKSSDWTYHLHDTTGIDLVDPMAIRGFLRAFWILVAVPVAPFVLLFGYALFRGMKDKEEYTTADMAHSITFFPVVCLVTLRLFVDWHRLWHSQPPTAIIYSMGEVVPEFAILVAQLVLAFFISRWDAWRTQELKDARESRKEFWENHILDALSYVRTTRERRRGRLQKAKPGILHVVEDRLLGTGRENELNDVLEALIFLKQVAIIITDNVMLEPDSRSSLWRQGNSRMVDQAATQVAVEKALVRDCVGMDEIWARRLAKDWCIYFTVDATAHPQGVRSLKKLFV